MSNVEYRCPTRSKTGCGARLFAAPGGTKIKCTRHDVAYEQYEEWHGATFEFVEDAAGHSRRGTATHLRTHTPTSEHPDILTNIKPAPAVDVKVVEDPEVVFARLKERYKQLFGKYPDKRFKEQRLRSEVARKEEELEAESQRRSAEMKAASDALDAEKEKT